MTSNKMRMAEGDGGRLYDAFQERRVIAMGWSELIEARPGMSRKEVAGIYARVRPDLKQGTINSCGSQVWRFINEVAIDDFCITYKPTARQYAVGKVTGDIAAKSDPEDRGIALLRKVKWLSQIDRDGLNTQTKNSLGLTLTLFQVLSSATNRVLAVLKCGPAKAEELEFTAINEEVEEAEEFRDTRDLLGRHKNDRGFYVSTGGFSKDARYEADRASIPVTLWDLDELVRYLVENNNQLDSHTRQLVPLKASVLARRRLTEKRNERNRTRIPE